MLKLELQDRREDITSLGAEIEELETRIEDMKSEDLGDTSDLAMNRQTTLPWQRRTVLQLTSLLRNSNSHQSHRNIPLCP